MRPRSIHIIATGGTIEKTYDERQGYLENRKSVIKETIEKKLRLPNTELTVESLLCKDSSSMTCEDRWVIRQRILSLQVNFNPIVILHGTDTMELTARFCYEKNQELNAPVVFTGAMKPIDFSDSDALQNVIEALLLVKYLSPSFYVSFHGQVFSAANVTKNFNS